MQEFAIWQVRFMAFAIEVFKKMQASWQEKYFLRNLFCSMQAQVQKSISIKHHEVEILL